MEERTFRMYGLVPYNMSPIQQGIQFGHAVVEYGLYHFNTDEYVKWANDDKTFIILNGGTTNKRVTQQTLRPVGTLNQHLETLHQNNIDAQDFYEPDLGDQLTAVVFLADDRVWDRENYPDFNTYVEDIYGIRAIENITSSYIFKTKKKPDMGELFPTEYADWITLVGGEENAFLREFLSQFKLA